MNICFGIVSYFPWEQPARKQRQDRLDRLVKQLSDLWPSIPIIVISQQWKYYNWNGKCKNTVYRYDYPKLGILAARNILREKFLQNNFDYLIMFDDDAIIEYSDKSYPQKYIEEIEKHPNGFCFIDGKGSCKYTSYNDSQLNLCAISKYIYEKEPLPNVDPQKSQGFEDRIWSTLLHFKYSKNEFKIPFNIKCTHFKNPNETAPSTWSSEKKFNWKYMRTRTSRIEDYIAENKRLPSKIEYYFSEDFFKNEDLIKKFNEKYHFMQLWGDCSGLGYLGDIRNQGPVDNVYSVRSDNIKLLLDNKYLDHITSTKPIETDRKPSFRGDIGRTYDYGTVKIIHNNPLTEQYINTLKGRINNFNSFYEKLKTNNNYYFTINFNHEIVNPTNNTFISEKLFLEIIEILKQYNILDKTILVALKQKNRKDTSNMWVRGFNPKNYGIKYIEIEDNDVWNTTNTHIQFINKITNIIK